MILPKNGYFWHFQLLNCCSDQKVVKVWPPKVGNRQNSVFWGSKNVFRVTPKWEKKGFPLKAIWPRLDSVYQEGPWQNVDSIPYILLVQFINPKVVSDPLHISKTTEAPAIFPWTWHLLKQFSLALLKLQKLLRCQYFYYMVMIRNGKINECLDGP